jgi:hypothetical protein
MDRPSLESSQIQEAPLLIGENKERWKVLCEQAAIEQEPKKLQELVREIHRNRLTERRK